jgi:hypothetical protein
MVVERMGEPVFVIEGERLNFKITVPEDVWLAELLIREGRVPSLLSFAAFRSSRRCESPADRDLRN